MSATYGGMYEWAIRNLTDATLAPFSVIKVEDWSYVQGEAVLSGVAATESGPHAVVGAIAIPPNEVGACAFPGAHWAETEDSYSSGTEVGPFSERSRLTDQGTGFITVGSRATNDQVLVAVRGGGGEGFGVVRGTAFGTVSGYATSSFTLDNLVAIRGKLPPVDSITVRNQPPCIFANGAPVYAAYNVELGSIDVDDKWDTGDAHNFLAMLKAVGPQVSHWDETKDQSLGHDSNNDFPDWQDDSLCDDDGAP